MYLQVFISAENREQADRILDALLENKIVAGGMISKGPAKFWWKGEISKMEYYNISAFTKSALQEKVVELVRKTSDEEVPMVWFVAFEGNSEFLDWIDKTVVLK